MMNKAQTTLRSAKSILARLMATENIMVQHKNVKTASFNTHTRVLTLPNWENMSEELYDLLHGHETGHAIDTPDFGKEVMYKGTKMKFIEAVIKQIDEKNPKGVHGFLNVVEDARIEKHQKNRYPGLRRSFVMGYAELMARDFFGIKKNGRPLEQYPLIDRLNIHFKLGSASMVKFAKSEEKFVDMVANVQSWDDVVAAVKVIYEHSKQTSQTDRHMGGDDDEEGEEGEEGEGNGEKKKLKVRKAKPGEELGEATEIDPDDYDIEYVDDEDADEGDEGQGDKKGDKSDADGEGDEGDEGKEKGKSKGKGKGKSDKGDKSDEEGDDADGEGEGEGKDGKDGNKESRKNSGKRNLMPEHSTTPQEPPRSLTDDFWEMSRQQLAAKQGVENAYATLSKDFDPSLHIVDYTKVLKDLESWVSRYSAKADEVTKVMRDTNKPVISYMVKEFEMRKAADLSRKAMVSNTGVLNMSRVHQYKYNEDLFRKNTNVPAGKNHGVMVFIDWSSSMYGNMAGTMEQLINLVMFCKRVNIPFDVYGFSTSYMGSGNQKQANKKIGDIILSPFSLLNLISSRASSREYNQLFRTLCLMHHYFQTCARSSYGRSASGIRLPDSYGLSSTPLNDAIICARYMVPKFQAENRVQIMNTIFLTDGESNGGLAYATDFGQSQAGYNTPTTFVDERTRAMFNVRGNNEDDTTKVLLQMLKDTTGTNLIGFFLLDAAENYLTHAINKHMPKANVSEAKVKFEKNDFVISTEYSYDELYLIKGGDALNVKNANDYSIVGKENTSEMADEFTKSNVKKISSRRILNSFIKKIA
jgi:hypothetical protein